MKLSDFIAQFLVDQGIKHVFIVSGGAIIHSIDSIARHPDIDYICVQHEQTAGAAAEAYSRISGKLGTAMVTSGPGATNLTTSICNAYFDSVPALFICGQVTTFRLKSNEVRQKGFQETNIVSIFQSITNYAAQVLNPLDIKYELEKAVHLATIGRPGPVVLDIPDDIQRTEIDPKSLRSFFPHAPQNARNIQKEIEKIDAWIKEAQRPVLIYGAGIRIANAITEAQAFARHYHLPVLLTWSAKDIMIFNDDLNFGGLGVCGPRAGNFAAQNSDLVIAMGTRLSQMVTGGKQSLFAPNAKKIMIDLDNGELNKFNAHDFTLDLKVACDLKRFFKSWSAHIKEKEPDAFLSWRNQIKQWHKQYPVCPPPKYKRTKDVDGHVFVKELSHQLKEGDVIIADTGANIAWTLQAIEIKKGQRLFSAWNHTPMGYSLPAAVGAALAGRNQEVIALIGDGGMMMCLYELATIKRYQLPVKVFIFNNRGHSIQKQTIDTWLHSNYVAVNEETGLSFPDFVKLAESFGLPATTISNHSHIKEVIRQTLSMAGPVVCNVEIDPDQKIEPMLKYGAGLEDLDPKIAVEELKAVMSVSTAQANASKDEALISSNKITIH